MPLKTFMDSREKMQAHKEEFERVKRLLERTGIRSSVIDGRTVFTAVKFPGIKTLGRLDFMRRKGHQVIMPNYRPERGYRGLTRP